jgi:hypothetical protein
MNSYTFDVHPLVGDSEVHVWQILQGSNEVLRDLSSNAKAAQRAARTALKFLRPKQVDEGSDDETVV